MTKETIETVIRILPVVIALLVCLLVICLGRTYHPMKAIQKTYVRIDGLLHEKKRFFDYQETNLFLMEHGAAIHFGKWIDPVKYLAIRLCVAAIGFIIGIRYHLFLACAGVVIGYQLPVIALLYLNNKDNDKMTPQIQTLYSLLQVQIHAGVPMADAMAESYQSFPEGRLKNALQEFSGTLYLGSFDRALEEFIESLCVILLQARESGQAMDLLRDISKQITDMQASLQIKRKEKLNRLTTFCLLGIMTAMIGVALYAFAGQMYSTVGYF